MTARKFLNINVMRKDINQGGRRDPCDCPVAHALSRRLKGAAVHVGYEGIYAEGHTYYCSRDIEQFMNDFDEGRPVTPARFTLERMYSS